MTREAYNTFVKLGTKIKELAYELANVYANKKLDDWNSYLTQNGRESEIPSYCNRFYPTEFEFYDDRFTFYIDDTYSTFDRDFITIPINEFIEFCKSE